MYHVTTKLQNFVKDERFWGYSLEIASLVWPLAAVLRLGEFTDPFPGRLLNCLFEAEKKIEDVMMNNPEDSPLYALAEDISIAINQNHDGNRLRKI